MLTALPNRSAVSAESVTPGLFWLMTCLDEVFSPVAEPYTTATYPAFVFPSTVASGAATARSE